MMADGGIKFFSTECRRIEKCCIFNYVENRLHLRKTQKHLAFHSVCTIFAAENQKLSMTLFLSCIHVADNVAWLMTDDGSNCMVESGKNTPPSPTSQDADKGAETTSQVRYAGVLQQGCCVYRRVSVCGVDVA